MGVWKAKSLSQSVLDAWHADISLKDPTQKDFNEIFRQSRELEDGEVVYYDGGTDWDIFTKGSEDHEWIEKSGAEIVQPRNGNV